MSAMAYRDTQWTARIRDSARQPRPCPAATGGTSDRQGAAPACDGCHPPRYPGGDDQVGGRLAPPRSPGSPGVSRGEANVTADLGGSVRLAYAPPRVVDPKRSTKDGQWPARPAAMTPGNGHTDTERSMSGPLRPSDGTAARPSEGVPDCAVTDDAPPAVVPPGQCHRRLTSDPRRPDRDHPAGAPAVPGQAEEPLPPACERPRSGLPSLALPQPRAKTQRSTRAPSAPLFAGRPRDLCTLSDAQPGPPRRRVGSTYRSATPLAPCLTSRMGLE